VAASRVAGVDSPHARAQRLSSLKALDSLFLDSKDTLPPRESQSLVPPVRRMAK
jgi:hypothetical protein